MKSFIEYFKRLSAINRSIVSACIGFVFYGGWAVMVNLMHGKESAVKAGLVQGVYSFILTFFMTLLLESTYRRAQNLFSSNNAAIGLTVLISCSIVFSGSWWVNYLAGTPEIFNTVILGYIFGGLYASIYTIGIAQKMQ
ncbi:hypothetical protein NBRC116583_19460 [Arenicella sp. 4NH20-0111]|uniref:hypothetical protein n=1 Tax=Arenicella sp. 4NH20-0111 TaxID=3127648 RepID=UPI0031043F02